MAQDREEAFVIDDEVIFASVLRKISELGAAKKVSPGDLLWLYIHYVNVARWQRTNCVYSTNPWTAKKTGFGLKKVQKLKRILTDGGLIEPFKRRVGAVGYQKVPFKQFIRIRFLPRVATKAAKISTLRRDDVWSEYKYATDVGFHNEDCSCLCKLVIDLYLIQYEYMLDRVHPKLIPSQRNRIVDVIDTFFDENQDDILIIEDIANIYFQRWQEGEITADGNINAFADPDILRTTLYEGRREHYRQ